MTAKTTKQPLSDNSRKLIIIIAIILVAVIVLSIALALILKDDVKTPAEEGSGSNGSSNLPIENGDFKYYSSDDTGYPYTATDWTKYGYNDGTSFKSISTNDKAVMGIINLDEWDDVVNDLKDAGVTLASEKPKVHKTLEEVEDREENNIYMIHNREDFAASILSDQVSVSSGASVKITVWLNMSQVKSGNVVIMIQKSSPTFPTQDYRYAFDYAISSERNDIEVDENGWQKHEFYVFNRETSSQYIKVSVGLGNAYDKEQTAQGTLFIDDITYETVTANEYRVQVDEHTIDIKDDYKPFKIIEDEEIEDEMKYFELKGELDAAGKKIDAYESFEDYEKDEKDEGDDAYLPFTKRDDFGIDESTGFRIYKISQTSKDAIAMRLVAKGTNGNINLAPSPINKDHYHVSFWVRVKQNDGHQATNANVYVQKWDNNAWEDITKDSYNKPVATFPEITTSQDVDTDANCGWVKYDIYLKPSTATEFEISILFVLGDRNGYTDDAVTDGMVPRGNLYVTSPAYEVISAKDYTNASTNNTTAKKINMVGDSANASVTNGSFTDVNNVGNQPSSWTPVFAGDNAIYKDGKGDTLGADKKEAHMIAGSGIVKDGTTINDSQGHALQVASNGTNFGYISNDISLSSRTIYVFSVMVKGTPNIYLINTAKETREQAIVAKLESTYTTEQKTKLDNYFNEYSLGDGPLNDTNKNDEWTRYYIVYVTEAESVTLRLALFSGKIYDTENFAKDNIVTYDNVKLNSIGTYSFGEAENEEATHYPVKFTANNGYDDAIKDLFGENTDGSLNTESEIYGIVGSNGMAQPTAETWLEMRAIPEDKEDNDGNKEEEDKKTPTEVDWGLLFSVISSVMLVAALLIVFVIKVFQARKHNRIA